jgi:hypothetical protein
MAELADIPAEWVDAVYPVTLAHGIPWYEDAIRIMLAAAAPFIAEQARREAAEHIAAEIERVVVSGEHPRPKYERGGFFNDASWAARIAREAFPQGGAQ